jgi:hypothetical protein
MHDRPGRFATEAVVAGTVIRAQVVGSPNLLAFGSEEELRRAFPLAADLAMLADFAFSAVALPGVVLLDNPPTMVNHATKGRGANTAFRFDGDSNANKEVFATRDIAPGDELLQDYRDIARVKWLEHMLAEGAGGAGGGAALQTARQLGEHLEHHC